MLRIEHLCASVGDTTILDGLDLDIAAGEVHAVMGPNGAGKSTLSNVLAGRDGYTITGTVTVDGDDLLPLAPEERAAKGLFLAFQHPVEIPGVGNMYFLHTALNAIRIERGQPEIGAVDFLALAKEHMARLDMDPAFLDRPVNEGFSGGEKKRNEILQMALLEPRLAILDETDSGLDIDALRVVAKGINDLATADNAVVLVTHYQRMLNYIVPDYVHVMGGGRIVKTGGKALAEELEARGYVGVAA